jgi:hypothetical protein
MDSERTTEVKILNHDVSYCVLIYFVCSYNFFLVMYMSVNQDCMNFIALDDAEKKIILFIYLCLKNVYF